MHENIKNKFMTHVNQQNSGGLLVSDFYLSILYVPKLTAVSKMGKNKLIKE